MSTFFYEPLAEKARDLYKKELFDEAIILYKKALETDSDNVDAWVDLGNLYGAETEDRKKYCEKALSIQPDFVRAMNNLGLFFYRNDNCDDALYYYLRALEIKPDFPPVLCNLGNVYNHLREFDKAEECFLKAIELNPEEILARYNLGVLYVTQNLWGKAIEMFNTMYPYLNTGYKYLEYFYSNLAVAYYGNEQIDYALGTYLRLVELKPDNVNYNWWVAFLYENQKDYELAVPYYEKMLEIEPNKEAIWHNLVFCCINGGLSDEEKKACEKKAFEHAGVAVEKYPNNMFLVLHFGRLLYKNKQTSEAFPVIEKLLKSNPEMPDAHLIMGKMLAEEHIELALPNFEAAINYAEDSWDHKFDECLIELAELLENNQYLKLAASAREAAKKVQDTEES